MPVPTPESRCGEPGSRAASAEAVKTQIYREPRQAWEMPGWAGR
jgi:hypothetical protein